MKSILSILALISLLLVGCGDTDKGVAEPKKAVVEISVGNVTATAFTLSVVSSEVGDCAYLCTTDHDDYDASQVLSQGVAIQLDDNGFARCDVSNLAPDTTYNIHVAVQGKDGTAINQMAVTTLTSEVVEQLGVVVAPKSVTSSSISFVITPSGAEKCCYMLFEEGDMPTIDTILTDGVEVDADKTSEIGVNGLYSSSVYGVVAAVSNGETTVLSEPIFMTTHAGDVTYLTLTIDSMSGGEWYSDDNYVLCLTDSVLQCLLELDLYMAYGDGEHLVEGRYCLKSPDTDDAPATYIGSKYSRMAEFVDGIERGCKFQNATLDISRGDDGYVFIFEAKIFDEERIVVAECEGIPVDCLF